MIAFIAISPLDHWEHMSPYVAQSIRLLKESGLSYELGPMGTTIEGESEKVFEVMRKMHLAISKKSKRGSTLIKIDEDLDRPIRQMKDRVRSVEAKL